MDPLSAEHKPQLMRELPHNIEAEQSLLGAIMLNNDCFESIPDTFSAKCFFVPVHGEIYHAISNLISQDQTADPITLKAYFEKNKALQSIKGGNYLVQLVESVVTLSSIADYAKLIYELYIRRQLVIIGDQIIYDAITFELDRNNENQIEKAESQLYNLAVNVTSGDCQDFSAIAQITYKNIEATSKSDRKLVGITTGFKALNDRLGGFNKSDLIILAGRPSMGKTALATTMGFKIAFERLMNKGNGGVVAFFSLEMSSEQLVSRLLSQESMVPSEKIRRGDVKPEELARIQARVRQLNSIPLFIDDTPAMTVSSLRRKARKLQRKEGLDLIIIDYLQLMQGESARGMDNRVQEISEITRGLKRLAKELDVPIIALSQLSRAVESRDDKRPQLADLRESGSIEQDADIVMFVYREEYYMRRRQPLEGSPEHREWYNKIQEIQNIAEVIVAKQRHGPVGTEKLYFGEAYTKFDDLARGR